MAWDRVTPTTVANCFSKCGFFGSPEEVPPEPEDTIEDWERLNVECTADDFCTADDNLATCGARTVEDIVEEATCEAADSSDDSDDIDVGDGEGPPRAAETLHALDVVRRAMAADEISDDTPSLLAVCANDPIVRVVDVSKTEDSITYRSEEHSHFVRGLCWTGEHVLLSAGWDGRVVQHSVGPSPESGDAPSPASGQ
ncbi:hypothetical protein HPB49_005287 [Dermacentor silvarum]|uniref:Uncharacterized protein n=1 Tax=Dermacentor silvarum TaxID=543639 RepID=A0ACB8C2E1_DERSI|nr:hypothetical protein HPB49_005287 [Dermacentor silvarum]